jgi:hypothetical protein
MPPGPPAGQTGWWLGCCSQIFWVADLPRRQARCTLSYACDSNYAWAVPHYSRD